MSSSVYESIKNSGLLSGRAVPILIQTCCMPASLVCPCRSSRTSRYPPEAARPFRPHVALPTHRPAPVPRLLPHEPDPLFSGARLAQVVETALQLRSHSAQGLNVQSKYPSTSREIAALLEGPFEQPAETAAENGRLTEFLRRRSSLQHSKTVRLRLSLTAALLLTVWEAVKPKGHYCDAASFRRVGAAACMKLLTALPQFSCTTGKSEFFPRAIL